MRARYVSLAFAAGLAGALVSLTPWSHGLEEEFGLYALFRLRGPRPPPEGVTIVGLDEASLERLRALPADPARWPEPVASCARAIPELAQPGEPRSLDRIPRALYACLVEVLATKGAAVIVFDVAFTDDPSRAAGTEVLARAIARHGRVVLLTRVRRIWAEPSERGERPEDRFSPIDPRLAASALAVAPFALPRTGSRVHYAWTRHPSLDEPVQLPVRALEAAALPILERVAAGAGWPPPPAESPRARREHLLRAFLASEPELWRALVHEERERRLLEGLRRAFSGSGELVLDFFGPPGTVRHRSLAALLTEDGPDDARLLAGAVVFVGPLDLRTALAADSFPTVFSDPRGIDLAGVELAATTFANLRDGEELHRPREWQRAVLVGGFTTLVALVLLRGTLARGLFVVLLCAAAYAASVFWAFARARLWLPLALPLGVLLPVVVASQLARYFGLARWLGLYTPRPVRAAALGGGDPAASGATIAELTVLFTDVVGSTALARALGPRAFKARLDDHFAMLARAIEAEGGELVEFLGDGVMAYWGGPEGPRDHAARACRAALAVAAALERDNRERTARGEPPLRLRIGIASGEAVLGTLGGSGRGVFTVTGDVAHAAQRIEQLGKELCPDRPTVAVLVSESTAKAAGTAFPFAALGDFELRGLARRERLFRLPIGSANDRPDADRFFSSPSDRSSGASSAGVDKTSG